MSKYTLEDDAKTGLKRIVADEEFTIIRLKRTVKKGERGGLVEGPDNLSQGGTSWIFDDSKAIESSSVREDALLIGGSVAKGKCILSKKATLCDESVATDGSKLRGHAIVCDKSTIGGLAIVTGKSVVIRSSVGGNSTVEEKSVVRNVTLAGKDSVKDNVEHSEWLETYKCVVSGIKATT
ncbi:MAG: hypothetical protein WC455_10625 [Dehalococcoidia bacterium]|jgi:NDP-sugar pyrophosphorylase family protein